MTPLSRPVRRVILASLDGSFGPDRNRRIVVTLIPGNGGSTPDLVELRPERTRRGEQIAVMDLYRYALRCRSNRETRLKAQLKKERKAARLAGL